MLKNKILSTLSTFLFMLFVVAIPVKASTIVSIQSLPTYINSNYFKISCTSNGSSAQFYVSKHGGAQVAFGSAIDLTTNPCLAQVTSSELNDQTDYTFTVTIDGSVSASTSTIYDTSGPSPVTNYYKERINDGMYKLHFHTPSDGDFAKVWIYRGETGDFSADNGHKIAEVSGGANSDMTYDDSFAPDASKTYYYDIRAIDKANNSSGLTGDGTGTTYTQVLGASTTPTPTTKRTTVTVLPKEQPSGSVLGTEANLDSQSTPEAIVTGDLNTNPGTLKWILTHKKISLGVVLGLTLFGFIIYKLIKRLK